VIPLSWFLFAVIMGIGFTAYRLGLVKGREESATAAYDRGFKAGRRQWQQAMEARRGPDDQDALVRIIERGQQTR
jgi:hypothetical protein